MSTLHTWRSLVVASLLASSGMVRAQNATSRPSNEPSFFNGTEVPTASDPSNVTLAPTDIDIGNTTEPTSSGTSAPSPVPTENATFTISPAPTTSQPSSSPTAAVTDVPTFVPTVTSTEMPSSSPTVGVQEGIVEELFMNLFGISNFPPEDVAAWEEVTARYQRRYFTSSVNSPIADFAANVTITSLVLPSQTRHRNVRKLQGGGNDDFVGIFYSQAMRYRVVRPGADVGPADIATIPFSSSTGRDIYVSLLNDSGQGVLANVVSSSDVVSDATPQPTPSPVEPTESPTSPPSERAMDDDDDDDDDDPILGTGAIIGIAVGGGVCLIALLLFFFFRSGDNDYEGANDPPPSVNVKNYGDEVSTIGVPAMGGPPTSNESFAGFGDQSVATVDYDYSKAYGGGGDTSVSSAGGTFGSQTHLQSVLDPVKAGATGAALGGAGSYSDADSFEAAYRDPNAKVKEELLNIFAPPGKLGVVIDTPDDGAPVVHAVKDSSVIADKIRVGDKLVAVDDEDVRSMTAIKVSKLISRKSANPSRKLTITRVTAE